MQNRKVLELWVGIFVAAGILALAMLAFKVGNLSTTDITNGYTVQARFDNIGGLKAKAAVTMAGVRIGRVTAITFDPDSYQALVTFQVDGRFDKIPTDTGASILTAGLLGDQYVGLEPGGAEEFLKDGGTIRLTQSAVVLEKLISQVLFEKAEGSGNTKTP